MALAFFPQDNLESMKQKIKKTCSDPSDFLYFVGTTRCHGNKGMQSNLTIVTSQVATTYMYHMIIT